MRPIQGLAADAGGPQPHPRLEPRRGSSLTGGGTAGNERLTTLVGAMLIVLLAVLGVTIVRIGQLIWLHLFVGLVLIGPLAAKLASTGYRFARYYAHDADYRAKGPPLVWMRLLAPLVVVSTLTVFISGLLLLFGGQESRDRYLLLHKASFIVWLAVTGVHVLGHLPELARSLWGRGALAEIRSTPGESGRWIALVTALAGGLVLAVVLVPQFGAWTAHGVLHHHH